MRAELCESNGQLYLFNDKGGLVATFEPFKYTIGLSGCYELIIELETDNIRIDEIKQVD